MLDYIDKMVSERLKVRNHEILIQVLRSDMESDSTAQVERWEDDGGKPDPLFCPIEELAK